MNYSKFLFSQLIRDIIETKYGIEYDILFDVSQIIYRDYFDSKYNNVNKPEYECMTEYIKDNTEKIKTYFN